MAEDGAGREVGRGFRLERLGAQGDRDGVVDAVGAVLLEHHARLGRDQIGGDIAEVLLLQGGGLEAGRDGAAQGEGRGEVVAGRQLAGQGFAEVGIVLVTRRAADGQLFGELAFDVDVDADIAAVRVHDVGGCKAGEALRTGAAGQQRALVVGLGFAGRDFEGFGAILDAKGEVDGLIEADFQRFDAVDAEGELIIGQAASVKLRRRGRAV